MIARHGYVWFPRGGTKSSRQGGFSLVELLVSIVIMAEILVGLLIIFDSSSRLARNQTHLAGLQQSMRVGQSELVRFTRMAGLGGLPVTLLNLPVGQPDSNNTVYGLMGTFPQWGFAVAIDNNVAIGTTVGGDPVLTGSDVLTLRGVFSTPMYYIDPPLDVTGWVNSNQFDGTVTVVRRTRVTGRSWWGYPQDLDQLAERLRAAKTATLPVALMLRDTANPNAYVVAAFDTDTEDSWLDSDDCPNVDVHDSMASGPNSGHVPQCIKFKVILDPDQNPMAGPGAAYGDLTTGTSLRSLGDFGHGGTTLLVDPGPPEVKVEVPTNIGSVGLLEEYRLFVRQEWEVPGDATTHLTPVLSRASFLPGTDTALERVDIADNLLDLQVAVAADVDGDGEILDRSETDGIDEILFNAAGDTVTAGDDSTPPVYTAPQGSGVTAETWYDTSLEFHFLRINTLVQARFPDANHRAPELATIEDHDQSANNSDSDLRYHRRWLRTSIELRNLQ